MKTLVSSEAVLKSQDDTQVISTPKNYNNGQKAKKIMLLIGFAGCIFCSSFPTAALGVALGKITFEFNDTKNMNWYMTAFSLPLAIFQLLCVRLGDCLGRRRIFIFGISLFIIASIASGFSVNNKMLISCRAIQGCASGLCQASVSASLTELFDVKDRITYVPIVYSAFGITFIIGPVVAGLLVDHVSWRFILWIGAMIFIPFLIIIFFLLDIPLKQEQRVTKTNLKTLFKRVDIVGCILIAIGVSFFLFGMYLGSSSTEYTWSSPLVIGLFSGSAGILFIFLAFEKYIAKNPLFPAKIILDASLLIVYIQRFSNGWNITLCQLLVFIRFQSLYDTTATKAALLLLPAGMAVILTAILASILTKKLGSPKFTNILGSLLAILGCSLLMFIQTAHSTISFQVTFLVIYNSGMGLCVQANGASCQLILEKKARYLIPTTLSFCQFLTHCCGAISTAFVISLLKVQITANMKNLKQMQPDIYQSIVDSGADTNYIKIREMTSPSVHQIIQAIYEKSINTVLIAFLFWCIIGLICSLVLRTPLLSSFKKNKKSETNV